MCDTWYEGTVTSHNSICPLTGLKEIRHMLQSLSGKLDYIGHSMVQSASGVCLGCCEQTGFVSGCRFPHQAHELLPEEPGHRSAGNQGRDLTALPFDCWPFKAWHHVPPLSPLHLSPSLMMASRYWSRCGTADLWQSDGACLSMCVGQQEPCFFTSRVLVAYLLDSDWHVSQLVCCHAMHLGCGRLA